MNRHDPTGETDRPTVVERPFGEAHPEGSLQARRSVNREFSAFYRSTIDRLIGFLIHQGASVPVAADIAQDAMTKAYRRWAEIEQPSAWLHTVASRALARRIADIREDSFEQVPEPTALLPRPEALAEWEEHQEILRVLRSLPPRQRQVLAWTLNGYSPAEIAEELRIAPEAVRASLKKARRTAATLVSREED
ncbi:sigma-70 family RNA polymerase sigma factor [Streptomyces sp. W16]|uniref:RNA polymerase sigma factor n=1 Tax=Streptomyces sp. W16 TaxID=3076631 RepID=UPI00295B2D2D|nr:sigma-70 family RNA polymerase sigma factor [Streptomyces sp. W16]MDV9171022.1 sigma-70 family RNA polymerase sigma factor [Streptomyces sp. W16]